MDNSMKGGRNSLNGNGIAILKILSLDTILSSRRYLAIKSEWP